LKTARDHGNAAVEFLSGDTSGVVLAGNQPTLEVAGEPVGPVGRLLEQGHALARRVFHALVVMDIAKQKVAALLPPDRPLGRPELTAEAGGQFLDRLRRVDDRVNTRIELFDALAGLCETATAAR